MSASVQVVHVNGVQQDTFSSNHWTAIAHQSHILGSKCSAPAICQKSEAVGSGDRCLFCQFHEQLKIPTYPDMTFARNKLVVRHDAGYGIEFNCMDALQSVRADKLDNELQVGVAGAWQQARSDCEFSKRILNKFDWTFRTDYTGTLLPASDGSEISVENTSEEIDVDRLKQKDEILYYESIDLFEDELADHGVAHMSVKIVSFPYCLIELILSKAFPYHAACDARQLLHPDALLSAR